MKLSISKKFAKRSIKCLALFAPLAYLFGSLFFGLNGAHNGPVYAGETDDSMSLHFDLSNTYVNCSIPTEVGSSYQLITSSQYYASPLVHVQEGLYTFTFTNESGFRLYIYENDLLVSYIIQYSSPYQYDFPSGNYAFAFVKYQFYNNPTVDVTSESTSFNAYLDGSTFSDYVFGQFFAKDNFLVQWGENAISENPVGFAPFGVFFKFLDENMLHLSDSQIGLMGYGYMYYCLHILLAFLAFDCVAFIPMLIKKVFNGFNKGVDLDD